MHHKKLVLLLFVLKLFIFFFMIYFYYFFIGKADIQRGETERKIFHTMFHSPSERNGPMLCRSEARSLFQVSHAGAGSQSFGLSSTAFPGHRQGAGREAGLAGIRTGAHMGSRACKARTFNHLRHRAGPKNVFFLR